MFCHCGLHSLDTLLGTLCLEQNCLNSSCWENSSDFGPHWSCATFKVTYINFLSHSDARLIFSRLPWSCLHTLICHVTDMICMTDLRIRYSETFASNFFQTHETQTDLSVFYFLCVVFFIYLYMLCPTLLRSVRFCFSEIPCKYWQQGSCRGPSGGQTMQQLMPIPIDQQKR